jgi:L-amino acid N-acyltransferase YncA
MPQVTPTCAIQLADPGRHAAEVAEIYRPAVETSVASFEEVPPGTDEMAARMHRVLSWAPWLVAVGAGWGGACTRTCWRGSVPSAS